MQVPILSGIYTDSNADFRTAYPRNMMPVPKETGISKGYLLPFYGITQIASPGLGPDRGGTFWNGIHYRVQGSKLISVDYNGGVIVLGDVSTDGKMVSFTHDTQRLAIASNKFLFYWDGSQLKQVTDKNLGQVLDVVWYDGYFVITDGTYIINTKITDPFSVDPLQYGSPSEGDPNKVKGVNKTREELYVISRYVTQVYDNVGSATGDTGTFPFQVNNSAIVQKGAIGSKCHVVFNDFLVVLGGGCTHEGKQEPPSIWKCVNGLPVKLASREVDRILQNYTEDQLSTAMLEVMSDRNNSLLFVHLPDRTLVFDERATQIASQSSDIPVWFNLDSGLLTPAQYRAIGLVWNNNRWYCGDPITGNIGYFDNSTMHHYGSVIGWEIFSQFLYNQGMGFIIHRAELIATTGRIAQGIDPTLWLSISNDGLNFSKELPLPAGMQGQTEQRLAWIECGYLRKNGILHFRGTSDAKIGIASCELILEALNV